MNAWLSRVKIAVQNQREDHESQLLAVAASESSRFRQFHSKRQLVKKGTTLQESNIIIDYNYYIIKC